MRLEKGYVQVYTGSGKGKTTAALGLGMRALGQGLKVYIIQFMKGNINYGELSTAARLAPECTLKQMGRECFVDKKNPDPIDIEWAARGLRLAEEIISRGNHDLVILDEINVALDYKLIGLDEVLEMIKARPKHVELVLTGRYAPIEIIDIADLVTEMREIRHYYRKGVSSRTGIEL
jgi:cob(I)alamin adenosyltransferase